LRDLVDFRPRTDAFAADGAVLLDGPVLAIDSCRLLWGPGFVQPEILLTLSAGSVVPLLKAKDPRCSGIFQVPQFVATDLQLRGLNLPTSLLTGFGLPEIDKLRDEADRAHCPVLLLSEEPPIDFTERGPNLAKSLERLRRLGLAASRLGCPSISVRAAAPDTDAAFEATTVGVKQALKELERYELNLLLSPHEGLTFDAGRLTDLIKKIGGFRIGSYPTFAHAYASGDVEKTLRKLAPYAPAICASIRGFDESGVHDGYKLETCVESILSVGYGNTLALDFVGKTPVGSEPAQGSDDEKPAKKSGRKPKAAAVVEIDIVAQLEMARRVLEAATMEPDPELDAEFDAEFGAELVNRLGEEPAEGEE
jgi:hypothetical protein